MNIPTFHKALAGEGEDRMKRKQKSLFCRTDVIPLRSSPFRASLRNGFFRLIINTIFSRYRRSLRLNLSRAHTWLGNCCPSLLRTALGQTPAAADAEEKKKEKIPLPLRTAEYSPVSMHRHRQLDTCRN